MNGLGQAFGYGLLASSALVLGALAGALWRPPKRLTGTLLAFASGTLIAAVALELLPEARELSGLWGAALGLLAGAATFVLLNTWLDRKAAPVASGGAEAGAKEPRPDVIGEASRGLGLALLASVTLDGLPENLALGASLQTGASVALLIAIFASNLPEAMAGAVAMRESGRSRGFAIGIWSAAALVLTAAVLLGHAAGAIDPRWLGTALAFAGGAVLASLADTLMPEAFERGRPYNAFATCAGFFLSFALAG